MKLKLHRHHLEISTVHWQHSGQIESTLSRWADEQLPSLLAARLAGLHGRRGYICIKEIRINMQVLMRHGLMPLEFDDWADKIVASLLADINQGEVDNIRYFDDEAQYIAAYIRHINQYQQALSWPFAPWYNNKRSVADNIVHKLQIKVTLLPQIVQWLRHYHSDIPFFTQLPAAHCRQLLTNMGCPLHPALLIAEDLGLERQISSLQQTLAQLGRFNAGFNADRALLVLALMSTEQASLGLSEGRWQSLNALVQLLRWLHADHRGAVIEAMMAAKAVRIDDKTINPLYQACCHDSQSQQRFGQQLDWALQLSGAMSGAMSESIGGFTGVESSPLSQPSHKTGERSNRASAQDSNERVESQPNPPFSSAPHGGKPPKDSTIAGQTGPTDLPPEHNSPNPEQAGTSSTNTKNSGAATQVAVGQSPADKGPAGQAVSDINHNGGPINDRPPQPMTTTQGPMPSSKPNPVRLSCAMNYGGLALVLAALCRHGQSHLLSASALWLLCCHAVPKALRPVAYSDQALRLLCLGDLPWFDGAEMAARIGSDADFKRFCRGVELDLSQPQASDWILGQMSQYLTGFELSPSDKLFSHFIDHSAQVVVGSRDIICRLKKPPLYMVISLSALFNQQPGLAGWPDRRWSILWQE